MIFGAISGWVFLYGAKRYKKSRSEKIATKDNNATF
jgi:hypothetical protein